MIADSGATWVLLFGVRGIALWYSLTGGPKPDDFPLFGPALWGARRDTRLGRSYRGKYRRRSLQGVAADVEVMLVDRLGVVTD